MAPSGDTPSGDAPSESTVELAPRIDRAEFATRLCPAGSHAAGAKVLLQINLTLQPERYWTNSRLPQGQEEVWEADRCVAKTDLRQQSTEGISLNGLKQ